MWALPIDYKTQYSDRLRTCCCGHPSGHVHRWFDHYLASKQSLQTGFNLVGREPKNHTLALASPIEGEHQPRFIARTPKTGDAETERPMPTQDRRHPACRIFTSGFPQERSIPEQPDIPTWSLREHVFDGA